jgi:hypothetical protein
VSAGRHCYWCTHQEVKPLLSGCLDFPIHFIGIRDVNHQPILCSLDEQNCPKRRFVKGLVDSTPHGFLFFESDDTENVPALGFVPSRLRADIAVAQVYLPETHQLSFQQLKVPFTCIDPVSTLICVEQAQCRDATAQFVAICIASIARRSFQNIQ